ncbi:MAG: hypothetical protein IT377_19710 [Polyangiaceae bacterium]|nr:hypothetical protein [Polyangiaceae bacterium]
MTPDVVTLLERIHDVDRSPDEWLRDVAGTAAPMLDQGLGIFAYFVDLSSPERVAASGLVSVGAPEGLDPPGFDLWEARVPIDFQRAIHLSS